MKTPVASIAFLVGALLTACGGAAAPASSAPAAPASKPAASAAASPSAKPAASAPASAKPAASASAAANAAAKPAAGGKLTVFYSTVSPTFTVLWIAKEAGIFQKNGLDVDVQLMQNPTGTQALIANEVQMGLSGAADMLGPDANGSDLVGLATFTKTYPYVFEVIDAIKTPADLKGKKIGASQPGGSDYVALLSVLAKLNIDPAKDLQIPFVGGTLTSPPENIAIESRGGYHSLLDVTSLNLPSATSTLTAHRAWIDANRATVQKFVDSLMEATVRERSDKAFSEQVMSKYLKVDDRAQLDATYDFFAQKLRPDVPHVTADQFKDAFEQLSKTNDKIKTVDLAKVVDDAFVQDAEKRGLGVK